MQNVPPVEGAVASGGGTAVGAVMLSLFAYPGSGHLLLKHKTRGLIWATIFSVSLALCLGSFFLKLSRLYGGATTNGSLEGSDLAGWMPILGFVGLTIALWVLPALDVLWLALRRQPADTHSPAELGVDQ